MRYRGRRSKPLIDWDNIDFVVGTRADVTGTGIKRPCKKCTQDVYTSREYPARVDMVCEYCALEIAREEEAAGRPFTATVSGLPGLEFESPLDAWQRLAELAGQNSPPPAPSRRKRRIGPRPKDGEPDAGR